MVSTLVLAVVLLNALVCSTGARNLAGAWPDHFEEQKTFFRRPRYSVSLGGSGGRGGLAGGAKLGGGLSGGSGLGGGGGGAGGRFGGGADGGFGGGAGASGVGQAGAVVEDSEVAMGSVAELEEDSAEVPVVALEVDFLEELPKLDLHY